MDRSVLSSLESTIPFLKHMCFGEATKERGSLHRKSHFTFEVLNPGSEMTPTSQRPLRIFSMATSVIIDLDIRIFDDELIHKRFHDEKVAGFAGRDSKRLAGLVKSAVDIIYYI